MWRQGSIRVGRIAGMTIEVHLTFALVLIWGAWQGWVRYGSAAGSLYGLLSILLLFGAVLLHEFGHGLQALAFGLRVQRITLLPIGGMAELESSSHPWQELVIALAGPMVNLLAALLLAGTIWIAQPYSLTSWMDSVLLLSPASPITALHYLFWVNVVLFFFNILPAFPMDGGRIIRAALALYVDYEGATRIASTLGKVLAVGMAGLGAAGWFVDGLTPNLLLVVVGIIVYAGARQEAISVRRRRALVRVESGDVCHPAQEHIRASQPLTRDLVARLVRQESSIPVLVDGRVVGLLSYQDAQRVFREVSTATAAHAMQTDYPVVGPRDTLWVALREMRAHQTDILPVIDGDRFCGIVTLNDVKQAWRYKKRSTQR